MGNKYSKNEKRIEERVSLRNQKRIRGILAGILAAVCMAQMMPQAAAETAADAPAETDRRSIRVAFPTQEGMSFFGLSGKVTGYNYDDLEKISEYTGWEMEYVAYGSADGNEAVGSAISDLREGKVDLIGPLLKNAATEQLFEFPEHSYGTVYTTLCARSAGCGRAISTIRTPSGWASGPRPRPATARSWPI